MEESNGKGPTSHDQHNEWIIHSKPEQKIDLRELIKIYLHRRVKMGMGLCVCVCIQFSIYLFLQVLKLMEIKLWKLT